MADTATAAPEREGKPSRSFGAGSLLTKAILVGLIDALLILAFAKSATESWWEAAIFFAAVFLAVNFAYWTKRNLPLKYLIPGLVFLVVFQLYTMIYTAYASFTNYGTGHLSDKESAIQSIQNQNVVADPTSPVYSILPIVKGNKVSILIRDPKLGGAQIGDNAGTTNVASGDVIRTAGIISGVKGYTSLNLGTLTSNTDYSNQFNALKVPIDKQKGVYLLKQSITQAVRATSGFTYDKSRDAMIRTSDKAVFKANEDQGNFIGPKDAAHPSGNYLQPGWKIGVGFDNYKTLFTDKDIRSHFLPILFWTFAFAVLTTILNFGLGLFLAMTLNERRMRGKGIYRALLIVPYGLPTVLMALVWKGILNQNFGLINQFFGSSTGWLTDTWLARFSVLMVNLWMGFPYFFLVCSGALTAIPEDLKEAAFVDGAKARYAFRTVVLPLLLVATAPLLVTTFAFNFNNYALIQQLTGGGPFQGSFSDGGDTDLLINYTFRTAFGVGGGASQQQLGLASAIAMIIFIVVGAVSAYGFRLTKRLEEIGAGAS